MPATSNFDIEMLGFDQRLFGHEFWRKVYVVRPYFMMFALRCSSLSNNNWQIKQPFYSWCPVQVTSEKIENATLFLRLDLPVHTNPSRKRNFSKTLCERRNLKTVAFRFSGDGNILNTRWLDANLEIPQPEYFSKTNPNWTVIVAFSNFFGVVKWTGLSLSRWILVN